MEEWVQVQLYKDGELITLDRYYIEKNTLQIKNVETGRILKQYLEHNKYVSGGFTHNGKNFNMRIHRIVASTFIPNPDPKKLTIVNHKSGIYTDNRIENLEWVTSSQNTKHIYSDLGKNATTAKLTETQVKDIEELLKEGKLTHQQIADMYGVNRKVIGNINTGKSYKRTTKRMHGDYLRDRVKITDEQALDIYNLVHSSKLSYEEIGKRYGTTRHTVFDIANGRCRNSLTGHPNGRKAKSVPKKTKQITENVPISDEYIIGGDWKDVQLYLNGKFVKIDGYKVNRETQQVKSFKWDKVNGKIVNVNLRNEYPVLSLQVDTNKSRLYNVHKIMMDTFKPENADTLPAINHINGNKTDNRLENLERCTNSYNMEHNFNVLGYKGLRGEECHLSKLTEIQVKEIGKLLREGELTQYQIADMYSVKRHIISDIHNGRAWSHLTGRVPTRKKYVGKASLGNIGLKLTEEKILGIYNDAWHSGLTLKEIGKKHGVGKHIVGSIKLGKTHSYVTGQVKVPSKNYSLNLTDEKILEIYNDAWHSGLTLKEIGKKHDVSNHVVDSIKLGKTHSYVTGHIKGVKPTKPSDTTLDDFFGKGNI